MSPVCACGGGVLLCVCWWGGLLVDVWVDWFGLVQCAGGRVSSVLVSARRYGLALGRAGMGCQGGWSLLIRGH